MLIVQGGSIEEAKGFLYIFISFPTSFLRLTAMKTDTF